MDTRRVDVAVIGAGTAGLSARREAAKLGASVVLIEGGPYGTTCARVGCMPSKLLIAAADAAHHVAQAGQFGIRVPDGVRVDGAAVLARVRRERDRFVGFVLDSVDAIPSAERLRGTARFVGPTTLLVDDHTRIEARAVVVATGSRPTIPPPFDGLRPAVLVSDDVFELTALPTSLAVIGSGIIGLELGQALHRLGVKTTLFSRGRLGPTTDPVVQAAIAEVLGRELDIQVARDLTARHDGGTVVVGWRDGTGAAHEGRYAAVLCATGRQPDFARLGLDAAGVGAARAVNRRTMQYGDLPIFFAGDVNDYLPTLHEATDEGVIAGTNAARYPDVRAHPRRTPLEIIFSSPSIAFVGTRYAALDHDAVEIGAVSYADQGRARVMAENAGVVRIYANRECGTLLGAEMFGPRVEHTAHLLAWAVQHRMTAGEALAMPIYHPVIEEGIRTALRDLCARLRLQPPEKRRDLECGPGS